MATDFSKRGFLKLFGSLAGGAMALSVLPDFGVATAMVGSTVLWTPEPASVMPIQSCTNADILQIAVSRPGGGQLPISCFHINARGGIRWKTPPGEGIFMTNGVLTEVVVTTRTYCFEKQDTCLTTVSSGGQISTGWMKG